jgi:hypothetical protein
VLEHFLVSRVVVLVTKNCDADCWVSEVAVLTEHVLAQGVLELFFVVLAIELDPIRLLHLDAELFTSHDEGVVDLVGDFKVGPLSRVLVNHNPLVSQQLNWLLNRQLSEDTLIAVDHLFVTEDLRCRKNLGLDLDGRILDLKIPLLNCLLGDQILAHLLNSGNLLFGRDVSLPQSISHACSLAHTVRYTVQKAELWRKVVLLIRNLDQEERLLCVTDCLAIGLLEVLSHRDGLIVVEESLLNRVGVEVNVRHEIGA